MLLRAVALTLLAVAHVEDLSSSLGTPAVGRFSAHPAFALPLPELVGWSVSPEGFGGDFRRSLAEADAANCDGAFTRVVTDEGNAGSIDELYDPVNGYKGYQTCFWRIVPPAVAAGQTPRITLFFSDFSMPPGGQHFLSVYSVSASGESSLIAQLPSDIASFTRLPDPVTCACSEMLVKFRSTYYAGSAFAGFRASYSSLAFAVREVEPASGPVRGGTSVTVKGVFAGHDSLECAWSSANAEQPTSTAVALTDALLLCTLDAFDLEPGAYTLTVFGVPEGGTSASIASGSLSLELYSGPTITGLVPAAGRYADEVRVELLDDVPSGAELLCLFEATEAAAALASDSSSAVVCAVPMPTGAGGSVEVSVSLNGQQFSASTATFTYTQSYCNGRKTLTAEEGAIRDHTGAGPSRPYSSCSWRISPGVAGCRVILELLPTADLSAGDDYVEVYDGGVVSPVNLLLRFPDGVDDVADDLSPVVSSGCEMLVRFRTGVFSGRTGFQAVYSSSVLGLTSVEPDAASTNASATTLVVSGHFVTMAANATAAACLFERTSGEQRSTAATKVDDSRVSCLVPEWARPGVPGAELVALSVTDGFQFSPDALNFTFLQDPIVTSVSPAAGIIGTTVTVRGANFFALPDAACAFGDALSGSVTIVDSETMLCTAPAPNSEGRASPSFDVSVSLNGVDFSATTAAFKYAVYCGEGGNGDPGEPALATSIGTISDHSGGGPYMPGSSCVFDIAPAGAARVKLRFDALDLRNTDVLTYEEAGGSRQDVVAFASNNVGASLPSFDDLTPPVKVRFGTDSVALGTGFKLTFLDAAIVEGECPAGGAAEGFTTTRVPASTSISSTVLDSDIVYHEIALPSAAVDRTLIISFSSSALVTDPTALAAYALDVGCPSPGPGGSLSSATVGANGLLKLYACTDQAEQVYYVAVAGATGLSNYVPYAVNFVTESIAQVNDLDGANSLVRIQPQLVNGDAFYVEIARPSTFDERTVVHVTVEIITESYAGAYAGALSANANGCGSPGEEHYRLDGPDPTSSRWELSIVEPLSSRGCANTGFGGASSSWVMAFFPLPGVNPVTSANYEANVQLTVDYTSKTRVSSDGASASGVFAIAPGQEHFFPLSARPILEVQVNPCAYNDILGDFDCTPGQDVGASVALEVEAQKDLAGCYTAGASPQVSTTPDSQGTYRLSACGVESSSSISPWVLVVRNVHPTLPTTYSMVASASDIATVPDESSSEVFVETAVIPGDTSFYKLNIFPDEEIDVLATVTTVQADPLLTVVASLGACERASVSSFGEEGVQGVTSFVSAGSQQQYRMTLHTLEEQTYFVSVLLNQDVASTPTNFEVTFQRRSRTFDAATIAASVLSVGDSSIQRAILPGAVHVFEIALDPDYALTMAATQLLDESSIGGGGALQMYVRSSAEAVTVTQEAIGSPGFFDARVTEGTSSSARVTYELTVSDCDASHVVLLINTTNAVVGSFSEYSLRLRRNKRAFSEDTGETISGSLVGGQSNTFELVSTSSDRTLVVQAFIDQGQPEESIALQVLPSSVSSCSALPSTDAGLITSAVTFGDKWLFVSNICADAAATYYVRLVGSGAVLGGASVPYEVTVQSQAQVDFAEALSPANPLSDSFTLSANTWQYNFMSVPKSDTEEDEYEASFALSVLPVAETEDGALEDLSQLFVYVTNDRCPTQDDAVLPVDENGVVDTSSITLSPQTKLFIGLQGQWSTTARHAFRIQPSFQCRAGFVATRYNETCQACDPGTFNPTAGANECLRCSIGEAQPLAGQVKCDKCGFGTFQAQPGQPSCERCPLGTQGNSRGASSCPKCPVGTYSDQLGSDACLPCPFATITAFEGATSLDSCTCARGFFEPGLLPGLECQACPIGAECEGGSGLVSMPYPREAHFQDWDETILLGGAIVTGPQDTLFFQLTGRSWEAEGYLETTQQTPRYWDAQFFLPCTPAVACTGGRWWEVYAEPDAIFDTNERYLSVQCAEGYANPQGTKQCNRCDNNYYRNVSNECVACTTSALQLVAMAIGLIALAAAMYSVSKSGFNVGALAITVNFFQVTAIFASFQIQWPVQVIVLFRFFEIFQIGIDIAQPECVVPDIGYLEKWLVMMALPVIFLSLLCTILLLMNSHHYLLTRTRLSLWFKRKFPRFLRKPERQRQNPDDTRAETFVKVLRGLSNIVVYKLGGALVQTSTRETREVVADSIINAFFMFLTLFYLAAVQKALEPFACFSTQFNDQGVPSARVMHADGSIECSWDDPIWRLLAPLGCLAVVIYGIGIPLSIACFLYVGRFRLNVMAFGRKFGYLYRRYEREWYFWEVLVLSRKLSLAATRLFLTAHVYAQTTFGIAIVTAFLAAQVFARPYEEVHLDMMETVLLSANYVTLFMGFTKHVLNEQPWYVKDQEYAFGIEATILAVLIFCLIFIVFFNVYDISRQLIRLYRRRSLGEGKYGAGQLLHLRHLDPRTEELQVIGQTYMLSSRREPFVSWLMQANNEEKTLFESVFKSFKFYLEDTEKKKREEAEKRRWEAAARKHAGPQVIRNFRGILPRRLFGRADEQGQGAADSVGMSALHGDVQSAPRRPPAPPKKGDTTISFVPAKQQQ